MLKKHVFLVGFMGVGKTTNGKKLARALNSPFIDLDELFVEQAGMSITAYFKEYGEEAFRLKEREILQHLSISEPAVIATGGGAPCFFDNMEWMNSHGITVYLQMPTGALARRLADSKKNKRPLIQHLNEEELVRFIEEKMQHRHPFYMQAHCHVDVLDFDIDALIKNLDL